MTETSPDHEPTDADDRVAVPPDPEKLDPPVDDLDAPDVPAPPLPPTDDVPADA